MQDAVEWLVVLTRWGHVMAGIAWIGTSFYFNWVDLSVRPADGKALNENNRGTLHEVHGGSFYYHERYWPTADHPRTLAHSGPAQLTFLSGLVLIAVLYWYGAGIYLIDPQIAELSKVQAVLISAASLVLAWPLYNLLCRTISSDRMVFCAMAAATVALAFLFSHVFGGRAAFIHVGAVLGAIMALNVHFIIVPNHIAMRKQLRAGVSLDQSLGEKAKRVSQHNNYFTLPVVFAMLSIHFPLAYAHPLGWLILSLIMGGGVAIRHYRNVQFKTDRRDWRWLGLAALLLVAAIGLSRVPMQPATEDRTAAIGETEREILSIVHNRCTSCHSARPTDDAFASAPLGFRLDTLAQVRSGAEKLIQRAIETKDMPPNNVTGMSEEERARLGDWLRSSSAGAN